MEHPMRKRESLEDRWLDRARIALQRYREAKAVTRAAEANHSDSTLPMADGSLAFRQALEVETVALTEYRRVLTVFNDLVIRGKMPPNEPDNR